VKAVRLVIDSLSLPRIDILTRVPWKAYSVALDFVRHHEFVSLSANHENH
jgi:hypothetical protein